MVKPLTLRELVEEHVHLGRESATGFRALRCQVCNDHSERAGFKFDGSTVGFHCFNCKAKFLHEEGSTSISKSARRILEAHGVPGAKLDELVGTAFFNKANQPKEITLETLKPPVSLFTPDVDLPPSSYPLGSEFREDLQIPLIEYLFSRRLDPLELNAHFSTDPKFLNRVIIPCMRAGKVIFWQARTVKDSKPRYISCTAPRAAVLWGYDHLWQDLDQPLFVTEGITDAAPVRGVALLGSEINDAKLEVLDRCRRTKVVVIDRDSNGGLLGEIALKHGWEITFVDPRASDINKSVQLFGLPYTVWTLMKNRTRPSPIKTAEGISLQSKLQLELAKIGRH
jgi:hypothetical protein